jgi:hypothetical protein
MCGELRSGPNDVFEYAVVHAVNGWEAESDTPIQIQARVVGKWDIIAWVGMVEKCC